METNVTRLNPMARGRVAKRHKIGPTAKTKDIRSKRARQLNNCLTLAEVNVTVQGELHHTCYDRSTQGFA